MGNWFATVLGIIAGVPVGVEVSRRMRLAEEVAARKRQSEERLKIAHACLITIRSELSHNAHELQTFRNALPVGAMEIVAVRWPWLVAIASSISVNAFDELVRQRPFTSWETISIWLAYEKLRQFRAIVKPAAARAQFFEHQRTPVLQTADDVREQNTLAQELVTKAMAQVEHLISQTAISGARRS